MAFTKLSSEQIVDFVSDKRRAHSISLDCDARRHTIVGFDKNEKIFDLRLPLPYERIRSGEPIADYLKRVSRESFAPYVVLLIQAGHAALGYFENGASSTDGWTRATYDLAGRVTETATFSGSVSQAPPATGTNTRTRTMPASNLSRNNRPENYRIRIRTNVTASGVAAYKSPIPIDGIPNLAYDNTQHLNLVRQFLVSSFFDDFPRIIVLQQLAH